MAAAIPVEPVSIDFRARLLRDIRPLRRFSLVERREFRRRIAAGFGALGADALDPEAVARVYEVKRRPLSKPLSIAVSSLEMLRRYAYLDEKAQRLAGRFLPGPLTLVLRKRDLPEILTSGLPKVGVRIPADHRALELIERFGKPVTATSANITEEIPPITVEEVLEQLTGVDLILDGGPLDPSRVPSTIVDMVGEPKVLREGRIKREELEAFLG